MNRSTLRRIEAGETSGDMEIMERLLGYLGYALEALERSSLDERLKRQAAHEQNPERRSILAASRVLTMSLGLTSPRS